MIRKIIKIALFVLMGFVLLFIIVNLLPTKRPDPLFSEAELNARGNLTPENGYFILLGIYEPSNIDPQSEEIVKQYIAYYINEDNMSKHIIFNRHRHRLNTFDRLTYRALNIDDWNLFKRIDKDKELIKNDKKNQFLSERLEKLINSKIVEDLNRPDARLFHNFGTLGWVDYYIFRNYMKSFIIGLEGNWMKASNEILKVVEFGQRLSRNAKSSYIFHDGIEISSDALYFVSEILNRCPYNQELYSDVIRRLSSQRTFNNGLKYHLLCYYFDCLKMLDTVDPALPTQLDKGILKYFNAAVFYFTFDANRTVREFNDYFTQVLGDMKTPPYKRTHPAELIKDKNPFWWFINYAGRLLTANKIYNFYRIIDWYYLNYAGNDLVIILAMLHKDRVPYDGVQQYLNSLTQKGFADPFTGKAYIWDAKEKLIKSKGSTKKFQHRNSRDIHYRISQ